MLISVDHYWTRDEVAKDKDHVYIFGDNIQDSVPNPKTGKWVVPGSTQAVIRGLPNAIGISTKKTGGGKADAFFEEKSDADFAIFKKSVDAGIEKAKASGKPIKISMYGLGTGAAAVRGAFSDAGRFFEYLYVRLKELDGHGSK
jgi:hypothetical protein